jgi:hypothetical protein
MIALLVIAAVLVMVTIVVSLATAADIGKRRSELVSLDHRLHEMVEHLEKALEQRKVVHGAMDVHRRMRDEKAVFRDELLEELEVLKEERVEDREIKVASGQRQQSIEDAFEEG